MTMDEKQRQGLEEFFNMMKDHKARHTELITVYVPKGFDINLITKQLESEKSTANNIKSTGTRKNVQEALESLTRLTKGMKTTPKNGVALFAGNVSQIEGQDNFITEAYEPPEELGVRLYRCDQTFVLDPLDEMLEKKDIYGLIVIDIKEVNIKDKILGYNFKNNKSEESECINKWYVKKDKLIHIVFLNNTGITSSEDHLFFVKRDNEIIEKPALELTKDDNLINEKGEKVVIKRVYKENLREDPLSVEEELIDIETKNHNFIANGLLVHNSSARYARIREGLAKEFFRKVAEVVKKEFFELPNLQGILVGGPGPTKEDFLKEGQLATKLMDQILAVKDIGYSDYHGLELLVDVSEDILANQEIVHEKKLMEKFFHTLGKERDKAVYGKEDTEKALEFGAVDLLLLSKKLSKEDIYHFEKIAQKTSAKVEFVSTDNDDGLQFLNLGGVGAILRFAI